MGSIEGFTLDDVKSKITGAIGAVEDLVAFAEDFDSLLPAQYVASLAEIEHFLNGLQAVVNKV